IQLRILIEEMMHLLHHHAFAFHLIGYFQYGRWQVVLFHSLHVTVEAVVHLCLFGIEGCETDVRIAIFNEVMDGLTWPFEVIHHYIVCSKLREKPVEEHYGQVVFHQRSNVFFYAGRRGYDVTIHLCVPEHLQQGAGDSRVILSAGMKYFVPMPVCMMFY